MAADPVKAETVRPWGSGELHEPIIIRITVDTRLFRWYLSAVRFAIIPLGMLLGGDRVMRIAGWGARLIRWSSR